MSKGPIRLASEQLLEEFNTKTKIYKTITSSVDIKHLDNYSVISINCSTADKKWFFHTVSRFVDDTDFLNTKCLLKGLETTFALLDGQESITIQKPQNSSG